MRWGVSMNNWFIVHDIQAYNEGLQADGSNTIGFEETTHNVNNIEVGDKIIYYFKGDCTIKGIYIVKPKPWRRVKGWTSSKQIDITPIMELKEPCNFKELISSLDLFKGLKRWQVAIQGTNGIRNISESDFVKIEEHIKKHLSSANDLNLKDKRLYPIYLPVPKPVSRDREFKSVSERERDEIVYKYLFEGQSHRWLDENVLNANSNYTRGYTSMGVLHHLGLMGEHKGLLDGISVQEAITYMLQQSKTEFKAIILSLLRYSEGIYSDGNLDFFQVNEDFSKLYKNIGISQYTDGVRINKEYHDIYNPPESPYYVKRGEARPIMVLFNNKVFEAEYRFEDQEDKTLQLQSIRFKKALKEEFKNVFPEPQGRFYIQCGRDLNHFIFTVEPLFLDDDISNNGDDEYSEGNEAYRLHRIWERKPEVVKKAKDRFHKKHGRLFCEACGFDFLESYGDRGNMFIEGHHTKLVSAMKEGEKTKVEDIALLCSNCHRMIHKKPIISVKELAELINSQI